MTRTCTRISSSKVTTMTLKIKTSSSNIKINKLISSRTGNRRKSMIRWVGSNIFKNRRKEAKTEWTKTLLKHSIKVKSSSLMLACTKIEKWLRKSNLITIIMGRMCSKIMTLIINLKIKWPIPRDKQEPMDLTWETEEWDKTTNHYLLMIKLIWIKDPVVELCLKEITTMKNEEVVMRVYFCTEF